MAGYEGLIPVKESFNGGEVSRLISARIDQPRYQAGCKVMLNAYPLAQGPVTRRPGFVFLGEAKQQNSTVRLIPFVFSVDQTRVLEVGPRYIRFWTRDGLILKDGSPYEVQTPFEEDQISSLDFAQSADVIYIASEFHKPSKLSRYGDTDWRLSTISFVPSIAAPTQLTATAEGSIPASGTVTYYYKVTVIDKDTGDESFPSAQTQITCEALTQTYYVKLRTPENPKAAEYRFYKYRGGVFGFIGRSSNGIFEDRNLQADTGDTPPEKKAPFEEEGNYPSIVFLWQQRLGWASSRNNPLTIWMSRSANYENLSSSKPPKDDDGIEVTIASESQNRIMWIMGEKYLLMGTSGAEYVIEGADGSPAITPSNISFSRQSTFGSLPIGAIFASGKVLYAQRNTSEIREYGYNFEQDRYLSPSLIILATHLIEQRAIVNWVWQQSESLLWCCLDDGTMIACTYMVEHDVIGWHRHETDGKVEQLCCIPGKRKDEVFAVICRQINGQQRKYIERLSEPYIGDDTKKFFYVDCGLSYCGDPVTTLTGLDHLEGKEVSIFADGASIPPRRVKDGCISLPYAVKLAYVGLPYRTLVTPNKPEVATEHGNPQSRFINIPRAVVRFYKSMNAKVGAEGGILVDVLMHDTANPTEPVVKTKDIQIQIGGGWDSERSISIEVTDPVPMTAICVTYSIKSAVTI